MKAITAISLLVRDYDEAIAWFTEKAEFSLRQDEVMGPDIRYVELVPWEDSEFALVLSKARTEKDEALIGRQAGSGVFGFIRTNTFWQDYEAWQARGVEFTEAPREESYATVVIFKDLYGNRWDLLQLPEQQDQQETE